jgi:hypothetical protein
MTESWQLPTDNIGSHELKRTDANRLPSDVGWQPPSM